MTNPRDVPALPSGVSSLSDLVGEWVIARVRGGYERKLVLLLNTVSPGIGYCLPMETVKRRVGGQDRGTYTRLIFPSYLFVCCRHENDYYELVAREGVFERIVVKDQKTLVRELDGFQIAAEQGLLRNRSAVCKGMKCVIKNGPLAGHQGWIDSVNEGKQQVVIGITILGKGAPTEISIDDVEPI